MKTIFFLILLLSLTKLVNGQNINILNKLIGNHEGELVYSSGEKLPITAEVYLNNFGVLEGKYTYIDSEEVINGTLYEFENQLDNKIFIKWTDPYGEGSVKLVKLNDSLLGTWYINNLDTLQKVGDVNVKKLFVTDTIDSKFIKLKSLLENDLITQEEYESKKKELLDQI